MDKDTVATNNIILIDEINVVIFENEVKEVSIFLGNIGCIYEDKLTHKYVTQFMSGATPDIPDEGAGYIMYKLWLDYLNGGDDSKRLKREIKFEWKSE